MPGFALPEVFTLPELQHVHEILIGKEIQKKSFRRRIEQADLLVIPEKNVLRRDALLVSIDLRSRLRIIVLFVILNFNI